MQARVFPDGRLALGGMVFRAALGPAGITIDKREGDGATPAGRFHPIRLWWRADRLPRPRTALPVRRRLVGGWIIGHIHDHVPAR